MRKLYILITLSCALLSNTRLLAQCGVTISTSTKTTQINCTDPTMILTANPSGTGEGPISYLWSNGHTGKTTKINSSGTYIVTMHYGDGANQCTSSSSIIISEDKTNPDVLALAFPETICLGDSTTLVALGANTYVWEANGSTVSSSATFSAVPARTTNYIVKGTGVNGCVAKDSIQVVVDSLPVISALNVKKPLCAGDSVGLHINAAEASPLAYQWYINTAQNNLSGTEIPGATSDSSIVLSVLGTHYYYCIVTGRCGSVRSEVLGPIKLGLPVNITGQPSADSQTICLGGPSAALRLTVTQNNIENYQWYSSADSSYSDSTLVLDGKDANSYTPPTGAAGTKYYYCNVTSSCGTVSSKISGPVIINPLPTASIPMETGIVCQGSTEKILFKGSNGTAPYTFTYKFGRSSKRITSAGANDTVSIYPRNPAGTYIYILDSVTDHFGCKQAQDDNTVLVVNPLPFAEVSGSGNFCQNSTSPQITFAGSNGMAPYAFVYNINGSVSDTVITGNAQDSLALVKISTLQTGAVNYNLVAVSDANGCTQTQNGTVVVNVNPLPAASIADINAVCQDSTALITFTGSNGTSPYTFNYNVNELPGTTITTGAGSNQAILHTKMNEAGIFYYNLLSVKDSNGCSTPFQSRTDTLTVNPSPSASIAGTTTVCQNSTQPLILLVGSGGAEPYIFSYDINGGNTIRTVSVKDSGFAYASTDKIGQFKYYLTQVSDGNGCKQKFAVHHQDTATITVGNRPYLKEGSKTMSICDSSILNYQAEISEPVTSFAWMRKDSLPGLIDSTRHKEGKTETITDTLDNITHLAIDVPYYITLSTGPDCVVKDSLVVTVNPKPVIDSIGNLTYCNGAAVLNGIPFTSKTPDASFTWTSDKTVGFGVGPSSNITGFIATNTGTQPLVATDTVKVTVDDNLKCPGDPITFKITVNPSAATPAFKWLDLNNNTLCNGAHNINFNVIAPADNTGYLWSAIPSGNPKVSIKDSNDANTVISFDDPGTYTLNVVATNHVGGCGISTAQTVNVTNTTGIGERKIILKQPGNLLLYPDNSMDQIKGYQWGYDSVINAGTGSGQDYSFGPPTAIEGQVYQFLTPEARFLDNQNNLDTTKYKYWVLLQKSGCYTKVYYNGPYADLAVQAPPLEDNTIRLSVMPNPNNGIFQIALKGNIYGNMNGRIYNAMGQLVFTKQFTKTTAEMYESINKINLSNGLYYLIVNSSDMKKAVTRFIIQH